MPLSGSGKEVMGSMKEQYGPKKGESVFYASINKGKPGSEKWEGRKDIGAPTQPVLGTKTPATFDRHDIKGYMDAARRGDAKGMKERADKWRT